MSTQTQPTPVLAWHREAARHAVVYALREQEAAWDDIAAIIAAHDPHQETVWLLEEAESLVIEYGSSIEQEPIAESLARRIRAHLAALQQEGAAK